MEYSKILKILLLFPFKLLFPVLFNLLLFLTIFIFEASSKENNKLLAFPLSLIEFFSTLIDLLNLGEAEIFEDGL